MTNWTDGMETRDGMLTIIAILRSTGSENDEKTFERGRAIDKTDSKPCFASRVLARLIKYAIS